MARAILPICLSVGCLLISGCEPLTADELGQQAAAIHSTAAEGALLADGVARQRTTSPFVRAHAQELAGVADASARKLHDATVPADLRTAVRRAIDLSNRTSSVLGDLALSPSDPQGAARIEARLKRLAARADRLGSTL
jgi:hypothetical protein